jgi:Ca-activated chloride channel family protein
MIVALLLLWLRWSDLFFRPTNPHAANANGVKAFAKKDYATSAKSFREANTLRPTPASAYNLGTSQVAAGNREEGSAALARAMSDPTLRADALYNRGNSALEAKSYDYAIRDFTDALRLRPNDPQAKRNLEIALARKAMQSSGSGGGQNGAGGKQPQQQQPQQNGKDARKPDPQQDRGTGDANADALLRAVQQQEKEELSRMRKQRPEERRIGW